MSSKSGIEWTEATWNPVTGCTKVSPGCANCYAERITNRFAGPGAFDKVVLHPDRLDLPLHWKKPRMIFVNSMSDLFHEDVPDEFIDRVFMMMAFCPRHTFQVLTKRAERMMAYCGSGETRRRFFAYASEFASIPSFKFKAEHYPDGLDGIRLPNVWLGVSVENQRMADERIPLLLQTPAAVRWVSAEPLLEILNLAPWLNKCVREWVGDEFIHTDGLDWVVVGGESGPEARQFYLEWARDLIAQCKEAMVPCFMKQLGSNAMFRNTAGSHQYKTKDSKGGDPSEWMWDLRIREYPK